ncbi:MAG: alpha/beta hydrolase [Pseudomonadota bacterium]
MTPLDEWRSDAQFFTVGETRLAYWTSDGLNDERAQTKPTLLLIHGFPTSSWDWTAVWPALEKRFNLAAMDMLGFGLSDKPSAHKYSLFEQADLQEALMAHLGLSETHILAHDYGVTAAQELIARQNERTLSFSIKSTVFLNGGIIPSAHRPLLLQRLALSPLGPLVGALMTRERLRTSFDKIFGPNTKASDGEIAAHWKLMNENDGRKMMHRLMRYIPERKRHQDRWIGALHDTIIPLRIIIGGADPISGEHLYHLYCETIANADGVLLDQIGHYPQTEAPEKVVSAVQDFHDAIRTFETLG